MPERSLVAVGRFSFDALGSYARVCADEIGMRDWEVIIRHDPCEEGRVASCALQVSRRRIDVWVCEDFGRREPEDQRHAVVHEITHALLVAVDQGSVSEVAQWMPPQTFVMWRAGFERELESVVDVLAGLLSRLVPLPDWT